MAEILITNYTGDVNSNIVVCSANTNTIPPTIDYGFCVTLPTQLTPDTNLPAYFAIDSAFDYDQYVFVQLSASTTLFTIPQLIDCSIEPPGTWGFSECGQPLDKNIYVFYDTSGSYPDGVNVTGPGTETLSGASQSIRNWYYDLVTLSGYTGDLYEIPIINERWINWACYPYLGSTTGGTLSDSSTVRIEMGRVTKSGIYTTPLQNSPIIERIALAKNLATGAYLSGPGISKGVPFDHASYVDGSNITLGQFDGGDTNYVSIIVLNESAQPGNANVDNCFNNSATSGGTDRFQSYYLWDTDSIGMEFTPILNNGGYPYPNPQNPAPQIYVPTSCLGNYPGYSGSYSGSSLQRDYESWLKVWEDVNITLNGFARSFLFPVPTTAVTAANSNGARNQSQGFGLLYQAIELMEASIPQASSYFQATYCENNSTGTVWPYPNQRYNNYSAFTYNQGQYYDFSPLTYYNSFTGFTDTSAYQSLPSQYQVGAGLKNFGWSLDATITGFTQSLVTNNLNNYFASILSGTKVYSLSVPQGAEIGNVYTLEDYEGCWEYTGFRLDGQPQYNYLQTILEFSDCLTCQNNINVESILFKNTACRINSGFITPQTATGMGGSIDIIGTPGATVDIEISWPYTNINTISGLQHKFVFSDGLGPNVVLPNGVTTGYTLTIPSGGEIQIGYTAVPTNPSAAGWEYIKIEMTGGTIAGTGTFLNAAGVNASLAPLTPLDPLPTFYSINVSKTSNISNRMGCVGDNAFQATSGASCSNFDYQSYYQLMGSTLNGTQSVQQLVANFVPSVLLLYDENGVLVNGGNQWIALANTYYTFEGYAPYKVAVQVDASGYVTNAVLCS